MLSEQMGYIEARLPDIDKQSEKLFLALGSGFPQVLAELRRNLDSSSSHLDRFVDPRGQSEHVNGQLNTIWNETRAILSSASQYFSSLAVRDDTVFNSLRDGIERLSILGEHIPRLRKDALGMEILATNAVIIASKAGNAGRGFAYLANELKALAAGTIEDTGRLTDQGTASVDSLTSLQRVVEEIAAFQQQFLGEFETRLSNGFDDLINHVGTLSVSLGKTIEKAREVETPLRRIMEEIQIQDIIMQSIAHVILVAKRTQDDGTVVSDDGIRRSMTQLCVELLCDIREKVAASLKVFKENLSALDRILADVGETPDSADRSHDHSQVGSAFEEPMVLLRQITAGIQQANDHRVTLRDQGLSITEQLAVVVDELSSFSKSITRLYQIQVLSSIQIAEEPRLNANRSAIEGMAEFVGRATTRVDGSLFDISAGLRQIERVVRDYSASSESDISVAEGLSSEIATATTNLDSARIGLMDGLDHFSVFSSRFHELLQQSESDVDGLESLVVELDELIDDLGGATSQLSRLDSVEDENGTMENMVGSILERFTIARHKSSAASLVGMELQEGSREGELTLF